MKTITLYQILLVSIVAFFWAICFPLIELGHRAAPPLRFAAIRSLIAGASIILPILLIKRDWIFSKPMWKYAIFIAITHTAIGFGGMFLADGRISPGIATVLANTQPLIAAVLAYFFLQERLSSKNILGLLISFLGIILIALKSFSTGTSSQLLGVFFILLGAVGTGAGNVIMKKSTESCDPVVLAGLQLLIGFFILFPISYLFENHLPINWHSSFFWSLIVLAIPGTSLVTVIWLYLLKKVQLSILNVFTFLTPAFGLLIGFIFFNEKYTITDFFGILLTLLGIYFATSASKKLR